jgi:hypothetical protein
MTRSTRMEQLVQKLKSRTDREGEPLPGYAQNVAQIKAEIAQLQESIEEAKTNEG